MNIELIKSLLTLRTAVAFIGGLVIGFIILDLLRQVIERTKKWRLQKQKDMN